MPVSVAESEENSVVASVRVKRAGASTAMFDAIGHREGIRHKSFFPLCQPSFQQGETWWCWQISVDSQAWGVWPTDPHDWLYQRPWSCPQRGCTGSDSARLLFLDLYFLRRRLCRLSLCFSWSLHADCRRRHHPTSSCVIWFGMTWCSTFSFKVLLGMR